MADRGDINRLPATAEATGPALVPVTTAAAEDADRALRPLKAPMPALAEAPPLGDATPADTVPVATPDSMSLGGGDCPVRCLRCCAMVCCRRWLTTSKGLVGELSTDSFTLQAQNSRKAVKPQRPRSGICNS